jgi:TRAP-type C4-dicarboxylate transport system permease small subunit
MNRLLDRSISFTKTLSWVFVGISGAALLVLTLMTTADTFMRYVFNAPFPASVEISQLIQPYVIFLPFAFALSSGSHVRVTLFSEKLKGRPRAIVDFIPFLMGTVFFSVMTYISWIRFYDSFRINETMLAAVRLYWWVGKLAMPVGLGLMTIQSLLLAILAFRNILRSNEGVK